VGIAVAFANQKGGVGKTTCCVNLAASLVVLNQKILLLDLDPQGNATVGSGVDKNAVDFSMNELLLGQCSIDDALIYQTPGGYDLIPSNSDLTSAEIGLLKLEDKENVLFKLLEPIKEQYDFILLDCPPALNTLTLNALVASDKVIIPMQCEYFALEGLTDLLGTIGQIKSTVNSRLDILGIIRTMYDGRNRLAQEVSSQLIEHFGNKVFQTVVPRNVRLAEAPSYGLPVYLYEKTSRGSTAYLTLSNEMLRKCSILQSDTDDKSKEGADSNKTETKQMEAMVDSWL